MGTRVSFSVRNSALCSPRGQPRACSSCHGGLKSRSRICEFSLSPTLQFRSDGFAGHQLPASWVAVLLWSPINWNNLLFCFSLRDSFLNMYCLPTLSAIHQLIHMFTSDQTPAPRCVFWLFQPIWVHFCGWCSGGLLTGLRLASLLLLWRSKQELALKSNLIFLPITFSFPAGWKSLSHVPQLSRGLPAIEFKFPASVSSIQLVFIEDNWGATDK